MPKRRDERDEVSVIDVKMDNGIRKTRDLACGREIGLGGNGLGFEVTP